MDTDARTLKERDEPNEARVIRVAVPRRDDEGVLGVKRVMLRMRIQRHDLLEVAVKVREVLRWSARVKVCPMFLHLDDLATDLSGSFSVQAIEDKELIGVELVHDRSGVLQQDEPRL